MGTLYVIFSKIPEMCFFDEDQLSRNILIKFSAKSFKCLHFLFVNGASFYILGKNISFMNIIMDPLELSDMDQVIISSFSISLNFEQVVI